MVFPSASFVHLLVPFCILPVYFLEPFGSSFSIYFLLIDQKKKKRKSPIRLIHSGLGIGLGCLIDSLHMVFY